MSQQTCRFSHVFEAAGLREGTMSHEKDERLSARASAANAVHSPKRLAPRAPMVRG
jgi:hypothetical protein